MADAPPETSQTPFGAIDWNPDPQELEAVKNVSGQNRPGILPQWYVDAYGMPDVVVEADAGQGITPGPQGDLSQQILTTMSMLKDMGFGGDEEEQGPAPLLPFTGFDPTADEPIWFPGFDQGRATDSEPGDPLLEAGGVFKPGEATRLGVEMVNENYFVEGDQARIWDAYSLEYRNLLEQQMLDAGLLAEGGFLPGARGIEQHNAFSVVLSMANYYGIGIGAAMGQLQKLGLARAAAQRGRGSGGGGGRSTAFTMPDYESIAQQSKDMFRSIFGHRDPKDWELSLVADYMQDQYRQSGEAQVQARLAGNGAIEIPDPNLKTKAYIEETWENELSRLRDIDSTAATHNMLISAATGGARMMGS